MASSNLNEEVSKSVRTIHLKSSKPCHEQQSLPSFSEFLSFTFPDILWEFEKEKLTQMKGLSKVLSMSLLSLPKEGSSAINLTRELGRSATVTSELEEIKCPSQTDIEGRTSFKALHSHILRHPQLAEDPKLLDPVYARSKVTSSVEESELYLFETASTQLPISFQSQNETGEQSAKKKNDLIHTTRSYFCSFCSQSFNYQKHLIAHVKGDHGEKKPFGCPRDGCWQRFGGLGDVNRHVKTVHEGEKRFSCQICERCFSRRSGVKRHLVHVHGVGDLQ